MLQSPFAHASTGPDCVSGPEAIHVTLDGADLQCHQHTMLLGSQGVRVSDYRPSFDVGAMLFDRSSIADSTTCGEGSTSGFEVQQVSSTTEQPDARDWQVEGMHAPATCVPGPPSQLCT